MQSTRVDIAARVSGRLAKIAVARGEHVAAGATLLVVDNPSWSPNCAKPRRKSWSPTPSSPASMSGHVPRSSPSARPRSTVPPPTSRSRGRPTIAPSWWRTTRATGDFDLRTFAIRAYPLDKIEGLRPGNERLCRLDEASAMRPSARPEPAAATYSNPRLSDLRSGASKWSYTHVPVAFLSHSSKDKSIVSAVASSLRAANIVYDELTFEPGGTRGRRNLQGISRADIFVLFLSKNFVGSHWVQNELRLAERNLVGRKTKSQFILDETP
jgi:pyruvate/2-oxoglutarate dehydrogenase complex dihydrolipoamide acyltransferase (E2) component